MKHIKKTIAPCIGASGYRGNNNSNTKETKKMQKMNFITKERLYRFLVENLEIGLSTFLYLFFLKEEVDAAIEYFSIRMDKRRMWKNKFAFVVSCIDGKGKIRDAWTMLFDYQNGIIVRRRDADAIMQNTDKQNSAAPYYSQPEGSRQWSLARELTKGYDFIKDTPTLIGMQQAQESDRIYIFEEFVDAIIAQILCRNDAACVAKTPDQDLSILLHPNIVEDLRGKQVKIYPQYGSYKEAKKVEYQLFCLGINVTTDSLVEQVDFEWKREETSIAKIALNMLSEGFSPQDAITYLGFGNDESF